ncbi:MAG: 4-hydroxy-tetrahydrodipicolinate reductase [Candidatus Omnitrophica bacterium]|nr:4-hydroxy-tetrahydrodipicolinate reductase [Candidatus Omnitrophota bacterium]
MRIKLAISGSRGKMGQLICKLAESDKEFEIVSLLERRGHSDIGTKIGSIEITDNSDSIKDTDVLIEFTSPEATIEHLNVCVKFNKPIIIGTTGLTAQQKDEIKKASKKIPIVFSPNMSIGVNLLFKLVKEAAVKLSGDYKVNITEAHHIHKKDAPSGTAKRLAQIIQENGKQELLDIKSIREDEITGDHEVCFESEKDIIKLFHSAKTRDIFAEGALVAAKFVVGKKNGLFDMQNILNEDTPLFSCLPVGRQAKARSGVSLNLPRPFGQNQKGSYYQKGGV